MSRVPRVPSWAELTFTRLWQSLCLFLTLLLVPAAYVKLDALEQSFAESAP